MAGMNEADEIEESWRILRDLCERLNQHCEKVRALVNGFEASQINNSEFSLDQPFQTTKNSLTRAALLNAAETYDSLRCDVREIAEVGYVDFEVLFPRLDINFETYYSVCVSLLNMVCQMLHMRIYCFRLLK